MQQLKRNQVLDIFRCASLSTLTSKTFLKKRQQPVLTQQINCLYFNLSDTYTILLLVNDATTNGNQSLEHFQVRIIISFNLEDISKKPTSTCFNAKDYLVYASHFILCATYRFLVFVKDATTIIRWLFRDLFRCASLSTLILKTFLKKRTAPD